MPKRKIRKDSPESLATMREALSKPREPTAAEAAEFANKPRPRSRICAIWRRGQRVFRVMGRPGADLVEHPDAWEMKKAERDFLTAIAKLVGPPIAAAARARKVTAAAKDAEILRRLDQAAHLGPRAAKQVADDLNISAKHVREVRKKRT